jgi:hypothetical protein
MRSLNRNKRKIYYANRVSETVLHDEYGNETGESKPLYGATTELLCNVSAASGEDAVQAFGSFTGYSRTICVADTRCPISEESIIWFGVAPPKSHNYIVVRKADSKNGIMYALQEVSVT